MLIELAGPFRVAYAGGAAASLHFYFDALRFLGENNPKRQFEKPIFLRLYAIIDFAVFRRDSGLKGVGSELILYDQKFFGIEEVFDMIPHLAQNASAD